MIIPTNNYPNNEFIFIDTNALIFSGANNLGFQKSCDEVLIKLKSSNTLLITHTMRYELLCHAANIDRYILRDKELSTKFDHYRVSEEIIVAATKLHYLYGQNENAKQYTNKEMFRDLIIGCSAGKHQIETGTRTTILSADHDFHLPYFHPVSIFPLSHSNRPTKSMSLYLYEVQVDMINTAWQTQLDNCTELQQDSTDD